MFNKVPFYLSYWDRDQFTLEFFKSKIYSIFDSNELFDFLLGFTYNIYFIDKNDNVMIKVPFKLSNLKDNGIINDYFYTIKGEFT